MHQADNLEFSAEFTLLKLFPKLSIVPCFIVLGYFIISSSSTLEV